MDIETLKRRISDADYIYDDNLATVLYVALKLQRPLLIEGAAGVGKTEIAKVMASALGRELVRLQCYGGLDESKSLYEWNYQKQLLSIQVNMGSMESDELTRSLFGDEYLLERPLLKSIRSEEPVVLLIDEIDKSDEEFEAFLLELLSDMQVSIPEIGTVKAKSIPFIVLTSNRARPISDALRRRCAYLYIDYPDLEKELEIVRAKNPNIDDHLAVEIVSAVQKLRSSEAILKKPSIAETLDWAQALEALGVRELTPELMHSTIGFVLKNNEDISALDEILELEDADTTVCACDTHGAHTEHGAGHTCHHVHDGETAGHDCQHAHGTDGAQSHECKCDHTHHTHGISAKSGTTGDAAKAATKADMADAGTAADKAAGRDHKHA